ncbi:putative clock controled protein (Ccg-8) [Aspergillus affinis]|uniref:putative clock controled protein (Ccg-8) n=1 Tax=Aspergillus affinis TaxID=1070780 RepID=UPI0022FF26CC|nr:Opi1-domain-containing protein [Aspergillus affinis]KAI9045378.1 Opi1-domain-containing protein [Aspergillus affinis]
MDPRPDGVSAPTTTAPNTSLSAVRDATTTPTPNNPQTTKATNLPPPPPSTSSSSATIYPTFQHVPSSMMDLDNSYVAEGRSRRATSVLSMDDIEAAQALEGLRTEYGQSPRHSSQHSSISSESQPEPLLSLLTSTHPLISSAINGSVSAYTSSKSYSSLIKSGAEYIERNIGSPVANTVGTVGRKTGVESGLRWALQRRASNSSDAKRSKRRKVSGDEPSADMDVEKAMDDAMMSESLPPYDDQRSPSYDEIGQENSSRQNSTWQSRLVISTSGLGVAMSEESLRSLQYCLTWLRWANGRLGKAIVALQGALKEWDQQQKDAEGSSAAGQDTSLLSQRIQAVREDVLSTLKQVVNVVSKYAGGALPENARNLVRRHLTSLPHRFQVASTSHPPPDSPASSSDATIGAHRILVLAQEGLDMMSQVSGVVNDTLVSAEHWCERLGRKRPDSKNPSDAPPAKSRNETYPADIKEPIHEAPRDVSMTGTEEKV